MNLKEICRDFFSIDFYEFQEKYFLQIIKVAKRFPFYRKEIGKVRSLQDLNKIPIFPYEKIKNWRNFILRKPKIVSKTAGTTGEPKLIPYSEDDLKHIQIIISRTAYLVGVRPDHFVWLLVAPPPYISGVLLKLMADGIGCKHLISWATDERSIFKALVQMVKKEKIDGIYGFPSLLLRIISSLRNWEKVRTDILKETNPILRPFLSILLSKLKAKVVLQKIEECKLVGIAGEIRDIYWRLLKEGFPNAKIYDFYGSTEGAICAFQPAENYDLVPILDWIIPEIIDPIKRNGGIPWWKWKRGMVGELVISRYGKCLPLLRYPTGDIIKVTSNKRIKVEVDGEILSIKIPQFKILGRTIEIYPEKFEDEMLIFGVGRVYPSEIGFWLSQIKGLKVRHFRLIIKRAKPNKPFPSWELEVFPAEKVREKSKMQEKIRNLLISKTEIKQGLVLIPKSRWKEYFRVKIMEPEDYNKILKEMKEKIRRGTPLGQVKPGKVYFE